LACQTYSLDDSSAIHGSDLHLVLWVGATPPFPGHRHARGLVTVDARRSVEGSIGLKT